MTSALRLSGRRDQRSLDGVMARTSPHAEPPASIRQQKNPGSELPGFADLLVGHGI